jgi:hypothetical protein
MQYELARELKDAGFPQTGSGKWIGHVDSLVWRNADRVYVPTLEELIKACGAEITCFAIERGDHEWNAFAHTFYSTGATMTEAVARLWLAMYENAGSAA